MPEFEFRKGYFHSKIKEISKNTRRCKSLEILLILDIF